MTEAENLLRQN